MLVRAAAALDAPMSFFFEGVGHQIDEPEQSMLHGRDSMVAQALAKIGTARSAPHFELLFQPWVRADAQVETLGTLLFWLRDCPARCVDRDDVACRVATIAESHAGNAFPVLDLLPLARPRMCYFRTVTGARDVLVAHAGLPRNLRHGRRPDQVV